MPVGTSPRRSTLLSDRSRRPGSADGGTPTIPRTFTYSSSTVVSQWQDKSGLNRHFNQGTVANQPNRNGTQNGHTTVLFDGTNDSLDCPSWAMTRPVSMFAVARNTAASGQRDILVTAADGRIYRTACTGTIDIYQGAVLSTGVQWGTTLFQLVYALFNAASSKIALNGGTETSGNAGTQPFNSGATTPVLVRPWAGPSSGRARSLRSSSTTGRPPWIASRSRRT